jgi:hypothetical protein
MKKRVLLCIVVVIILSLCLSACDREQAQVASDPALLEFPGLKWNSSVSEVKKALNLKKEQILGDEMLEDGQEYDTWVLAVTGIEVFGFEPELARFNFIRYPGNEYGLLNIMLEFPGTVDTNMLRDNMVEVYGEGTLEDAPHYSFNEEGLLEETDPDTIIKSGDAEEGYPYYWFSTVNGIETMSAEALERYIEYALNNNNLGIKQEAVVDYLEKTSAVQVTCMAWTTKEITRVTFYANMLAHNWQQFGK